MMDEEYSGESKEGELKRADHMIYVTLKYTRTVDVMKNIIKRFISTFDYAVTEALEKKGVKPSNIALVRFEQLCKKIKDVNKYKKFYLLLRKIDKAKFTGKEEYRKNVRLVVGKREINVDVLKEYFEKTKEFVKLFE